jgi:hypothetical protein
MNSNYTKIYIGNPIEAQGLLARLQEVDIIAVVKNEEESARLAGFGASPQSSAEVYVHKDELEKAMQILKQDL